MEGNGRVLNTNPRHKTTRYHAKTFVTYHIKGKELNLIKNRDIREVMFHTKNIIHVEIHRPRETMPWMSWREIFGRVSLNIPSPLNKIYMKKVEQNLRCKALGS